MQGVHVRIQARKTASMAMKARTKRNRVVDTVGRSVIAHTLPLMFAWGWGNSLPHPLTFQTLIAKFIGEAFKIERIQRAVNAARFSYFLDGSIPSRRNFTLRLEVSEIALGYSDIINKDAMAHCINQNFSKISFHSPVMPNILALVKPSDDILRQKSWRDKMCVMAREVITNYFARLT